MERQFVQKYPNAHLDRFRFNVVLSKTSDVTKTSVSFKVRDDQFLDITTEDFKKLYSGELHWLPRIWDTSGTVQPFALSSATLPYNYRKFTIYVNARSGFTSNFDALTTSWKGTANDITKMDVNKDDPYLHRYLPPTLFRTLVESAENIQQVIITLSRASHGITSTII